MKDLHITEKDLDEFGFYKHSKNIKCHNLRSEVDFKVTGNLYCEGNLCCWGCLDCEGNLCCWGNLYCEGNLCCWGCLYCEGNLCCWGNLDCKGNLCCWGCLDCKGNLCCKGNLDCWGNLCCKGNLDCKGTIKIRGMRLFKHNSYLNISGVIGSHRSPLIAYNTIDGVYCKKGCFFGKLDELVPACIRENGEDSHHIDNFKNITRYLKLWGEQGRELEG